jgi:hypothetical protein
MSSGPNIVRDGLVFHYDLSDGKSFAGEPTTNYIYHQNPRIDGTYTSYMPESGQGTIAVNHPQSIRVYNIDGNDISYYINGGVTDWTNARHAYWIYDNDLKKPVVQSYDVTGSWQAKYLDAGMGAWSSLGMSAGSKYTISWLQWTNNLTKRAHVGFYSRDNGGGFNFWDGLSTVPVNTKTHTWERLSQTFTVSASRNLNDTFGNVYFYTHVFDYGIIRIADVQLELKDHPTKFSPTLTRNSTSSLIDRTRTMTSIDVSNVSFNSTGKMIFDGTNDYIFSPSAAPLFTNNVTFSCWFKTSVQQTNKYIMAMGRNLTGNNGMDLCLQGTDVASYIVGSSSSIYLNYNTNYQNNQWHMLTVTYNGTTAVLYYDGVAVNSGPFTQNVDIEATRRLAIGSWVNGGANFNGEIDVMQIYNRGLSASEVSQNYNSLRKKFGV